MFTRNAFVSFKHCFKRVLTQPERVIVVNERGYAKRPPPLPVNDKLNFHHSTATKPQESVCSTSDAAILSSRDERTFPRALNASSFASILNDIDTFIFDADGVLWLGDETIDGSPQFFDFLSRHGKQVIVLTNNANKSRSALASKLRSKGFVGTSEEKVVCPSAIIVHHLTARGFQKSGKSAYLIGSKDLSADLDNAGIKHFGWGPDPNDGTDLDEENLMNRDAFVYQGDVVEPVGAVIVGFDKHFNYVKLLRAANYLQDRGCLFLGTNEDETSPGPHPNTVIPDTGPIIAAVKNASGRQPLVAGKPHTAAFDFIRARWNIRPHRTMMIGDRTNTDVLFGHWHGLRTTLVLSGCHSLEDVEQQQRAGLTDMVPHYYAQCLGSLVQ